MPLTLDSEIAAVLAAAMEAAGEVPVPARGDALALRTLTNATLVSVDTAEPDSPHVSSKDYQVTVADGSSILARWYMKSGAGPGSAVVCIHGGGMVCGSVDLYDRIVSKYVEQAGVPFL